MATSKQRVAEIRKLEAEVLSDRRNANKILDIRRVAETETETTTTSGSSCSKEVKLAAVHSLRRIFSEILESGIILASKSTSSSSSSTSIASLQKYIIWIVAQINSYVDLLCGLVHSDDLDIQAVSIRTLMEFVMREHMYRPEVVFGVHTYTKLLRSLLLGPDIDVDILLMFRDEVLDKTDCIFYTLKITRRFLTQLKELRKEMTYAGDKDIEAEIISKFVRSGTGFGSDLAISARTKKRI